MEDDRIDCRVVMYYYALNESKKKSKIVRVVTYTARENRVSEKRKDGWYRIVQQLWPERERQREGRKERDRATRCKVTAPFAKSARVTSVQQRFLSQCRRRRRRESQPTTSGSIRLNRLHSKLTTSPPRLFLCPLPQRRPSPSSSLLCSSPFPLSLSPSLSFHSALHPASPNGLYASCSIVGSWDDEIYGGCCRWCTERTGVWGLPSNPSFSHRPPWRTAPVWDHTTTNTTTTITITTMVLPPSARVVRWLLSSVRTSRC